MLQRIHDSAARWIMIVLMGFIALGFVFWRADFNPAGTATFAAKVNGQEVTLTEFDRELQARQTQYQQLYRAELSEDMRRELRRAVIEDMVRESALKQRVEDQGYRVSDARVTQSIRDVAAFQVDGQFDLNVYRGLLANQGMSPVLFEELQRESLEIRDLETGIADSTFLTPAEFRRYIELFNQRREIAYALFDTEAFTADVSIDDDAIMARYESNQASYQTTETVDLEYIELALADIAASVDVSEEALRRAYEEEKDRFQTLEERHARHILIEVADGQEDAARTQAQGIADRLRGGEDFATLAAEFSADAGTKTQGGDLGWIGRGMLVGPFEDALFALQQGEISDPVRSDFGYHVIKLDEIRAGEVQPFEDVRGELEAETRTRRAEDEFYDRANELSDKAFDAYNELATVAGAMMLPLKTLEGFPRTGDPNAFPNSPAVVQAAFAEEVLDSGRNSQLVELGDDHVLVLRVTGHHLPTTKPLDEVRDQIREELTRERAQSLAEEAATAFRAEIEQGDDPAMAAAAHKGTWVPTAWVERTDDSVPTEVLSGAFALPKPAEGAVQRELIVLANGSQAVVELRGVQAGEPSSMTQAERDQRQKQLADQAARAELTGYIGNVRAKADVRIPADILEPPVY